MVRLAPTEFTVFGFARTRFSCDQGDLVVIVDAEEVFDDAARPVGAVGSQGAVSRHCEGAVEEQHRQAGIAQARYVGSGHAGHHDEAVDVTTGDVFDEPRSVSARPAELAVRRNLEELSGEVRSADCDISLVATVEWLGDYRRRRGPALLQDDRLLYDQHRPFVLVNGLFPCSATPAGDTRRSDSRRGSSSRRESNRAALAARVPSGCRELAYSALSISGPGARRRPAVWTTPAVRHGRGRKNLRRARVVPLPRCRQVPWTSRQNGGFSGGRS